MFTNGLFDEKDRNAVIGMIKDASLACFIYSKNVLVGARRQVLSSGRVVAKGGAVMLPVSAFSEYLGLSVTTLGGEAELTDNSGARFRAPLYTSGGVEYLPIMDACAALGISARLFYHDRLVLVAPRAVLDFIGSDEKYEECLAYEIFGDYDATSFTKADYDRAKDRFRENLVGTAEINDLTDPAIAEKIAEVDRLCELYSSQINRAREDGSDPVILWGDKAPTESGELSYQYNRILALAKGYGTYGSRFYKNEGVLADILYALRWMNEHMYGDAEIEERGYRSAHIFNWWYWFVGAPNPLCDTMLIIEDKLTYAQKKQYLKCFEWVTTFMRTGNLRPSASSRMNPCTKTALLLEDPVRLQQCHLDCDILMGISHLSEGVHKDFCQWTHGMPHNISYGMGNLERTLFISALLAPTPMDFSGPKKYNQFLIAKYLFEPAMYRGQGFMMFSGRSTAGSELSYGTGVILGLLPMIGVYGEDEDNYLKHMIKRHVVGGDMLEFVKSKCSIVNIAKLMDIMNDPTVSAEDDYEYAHAWYTGDRCAQHRAGYAFGVALSSVREQAYESINSANQTGWYTGDGATYLYTSYDNRQFDGRNFQVKNTNIAYRIPGTTEDSQPRVARAILNGEAWHNPTDFAGSISIDSKYVVAAMDFIAMHFEGPDKNIVDTGYGSGLAVHHNDLRLKKAYFCLDGEIVCLGAGITSTMHSPVHTTLEHRRIMRDAELMQYVSADSAPLPKSDFEITMPQGGWALMEGHAGFVCLDSGALYVRRYHCAEADEQDFIEIGIDHGADPENASYAYAILPYATRESVAGYYNAPRVAVLENTTSVQAVRSESLGGTFAVFHAPGLVGGIAADAPCILALTEREGGVRLIACDPTFKLESYSVTLDGEYSLAAENARAAVVAQGGKTVITVDCRDLIGESVTVELKK